jgi:hypothetical protein
MFKDHTVATCQTEISADGFEIIHLQNSCMSVSVMPQLGGKIYTIVDLRTGRDWLWKNPHIALRHPAPDMDYERELDSGGWDEILFSVKPSSLELPNGQHLAIGDHGTVVDKAWTRSGVGTTAAGEAFCELFVEGLSPHFRLDRKIVMDARKPQFEIEYRLMNTGQTAWPWFWCAHPLLAIESGMYIDLKQGQAVRLVKDDALESASGAVWPMILDANNGQVDISKIFEETGSPRSYCQKLYVRSNGQISLRTGDANECFSMIFSPEFLPWLGLWINKNAWSGCGSEPYLNLGMEPATNPHDKLSEAITSDQACFLQAGESIKWSLSINLYNKVDTHD